MATRRRGPRRSKTISVQGLTGQKGVNLIERIVLDIDCRWTPSGPNEVGIDGYIELFDPASRKPLGLTLAAQSKVLNPSARDRCGREGARPSRSSSPSTDRCWVQCSSSLGADSYVTLA
jgi:hypothetical protein